MTRGVAPWDRAPMEPILAMRSRVRRHMLTAFAGIALGIVTMVARASRMAANTALARSPTKLAPILKS